MALKFTTDKTLNEYIASIWPDFQIVDYDFMGTYVYMNMTVDDLFVGSAIASILEARDEYLEIRLKNAVAAEGTTKLTFEIRPRVLDPEDLAPALPLSPSKMVHQVYAYMAGSLRQYIQWDFESEVHPIKAYRTNGEEWTEDFLKY